jgi:hypothetical protein
MSDAAECADGAVMTTGREIRVLDDIAACLRAMASHGIVYDDEVLLWLADQVENAADRTQEAADVDAALAIIRTHQTRGRPDPAMAEDQASPRSEI